MRSASVSNVRLTDLRPLVRYVDEDLAVVEIHVTATAWEGTSPFHPASLDLWIELDSAEGFHDEQRQSVALKRGEGMARIELVRPQRWWPAGMGEQSLYSLTVRVLGNNAVLDAGRATFGLTSVRMPDQDTPAALLINGQTREVRRWVAVDRVDERRLLPVSGDSMMIVRDHYGADVLYDAADRAGILVIQCIPIHADGKPESEVGREVSRLAIHPSLAGWFVGHQGRLAGRIAGRLQALDPTHPVLTQVNPGWAA